MPAQTIIPETFYESTLDDERRRPVHIWSVYPKAVVITHGARSINVPECREGMRVAKSDPIGPGFERRDFGSGQQTVIENISARDNALDAMGLTRERVNARGESIKARTSSDWWECGFFVPEGDEPTDKEVASARARLNAWARRWIDKGDQSFATDQKPARVDFRAKLAAVYLHIRRPWAEGAEVEQQKTVCPSCRCDVNAGFTKCQNCGDRFVYIDGKPVREDLVGGAPHSSMPTTPPPNKNR